MLMADWQSETEFLSAGSLPKGPNNQGWTELKVGGEHMFSTWGQGSSQLTHDQLLHPSRKLELKAEPGLKPRQSERSTSPLTGVLTVRELAHPYSGFQYA